MIFSISLRILEYTYSVSDAMSRNNFEIRVESELLQVSGENFLFTTEPTRLRYQVVVNTEFSV